MRTTGAAFCRSCGEIVEATTHCPRCRGPIDRSLRGFRKWEQVRIAKRIQEWHDAGLVDDVLREKLSRHEPDAEEESEEEEEEVVTPRRETIEARADAIYGSIGSFFGETSVRYRRIVERIEAEAPPPSSVPEHDDRAHGDEAAEAGRAVFAARGAVVGAGLHALGELDDDDAPKRPLSAGLQVFWFIGVVLVLAGSLMGVREAWRSLEGALRPLAIAGALFAYHVVFAGLARLLGRRSEITGRVLGVIAVGLVPIAFVAVAVAYGMGHSAGLASAAALLAASCATIFWVGRVFDRTAGVGLVLGLVPCLALEVPLGEGTAVATRLLVPLAALVPLFVASITRRGIAMLGAAAYGAIVVALFAVFGGPSDVALELGTFGRPALAAVLWIAAAAAIGWNGAERVPRVAPVVRIVLLAVLVGASLTGVASALSVTRETVLGTGAFGYAPAAACALATFALAMEQRKYVLALWFAVPLAHLAVFVAAAVFTGRPDTSVAAMVLVPMALLLTAPAAKGRSHRIAVTVLATVSAFVVVLATLGAEITTPQRDPLTTTAAIGLVLCVAAHLGGRTVRPGLHYLGAAMALFAVFAYVMPIRPEPDALVALTVSVSVSGVYGLLALPYALVAGKDEHEIRPFDDVSLILAVVTVYAAWANDVPFSWTFPTDPPVLSIDRSMIVPPAAAFAILALRAARDRSRLVTLQAGIAGAVSVHCAAVALGGWGLWPSFGLATLGLVVPAMFRSAEERASGRPLLGIVPIPLGARGRLLLDGFAFASVLCAGIMCLRGIGWISASDYGNLATRELTVLGLVCVVVAALVAFFSRAYDALFARGNVATLAIGGLVVAITAITYRIGRPLPPAVVGWRIPIVLTGVWLLAQLLVKKGSWLGVKLERPAHGALYHFVPHAGVGALGLLLFADAFLVGSPTSTRFLALVPPLFFAGSALAAFLLWRSFRRAPFLHVGLALLLAFAWLAGAQRHVLGPELLPLDPPGGRWMPPFSFPLARAWPGAWLDPGVFLPGGDTELLLWERAYTGGAVAALAYAGTSVGLSRRGKDEIAGPLLVWTSVGLGVLAFALAWQPALVPAVVVLVAGIAAVAARGSPLRALPLVLAAPLLVHAFAHDREVVVPEWPGPVLALETFVVVGGGVAASQRAGRDTRILLASQILGALYGALAIAYASAVFGLESRTAALPRILDLAQRASDGDYARSFSLAVTLGVLAVTAGAGAWAWRGAIARVAAIAPPLILAWAAFAGAAAFVYTNPNDVLPGLVTRNGPLLGACLAAAAAVAHVASIALFRRGHEPAAQGTRIGRDAVLASAALSMIVFVLGREAGGVATGILGVVALGLPIAVGVDAIAREGSKRHVYFVEMLVVALYAFATDNMNLRPEIDAMLGLGYGFTLLGVAVLARRQKLVGVADATRRFLAVLPVVVAVLTMRNASDAAAAYAVGSSILYATVAFTERSRAFGSLAAIAANVALVVFALAQGLDGVEIWLGPLGLLVAAIAQIFASKMAPSARSAVRIVGGVLLYLPSGFKLALRLGAAEDATYSVVFGAVCLLGVLAGVVLRVRAYLVLGTMALTLDVVANLVHAGLRDHRLGFVILSASGLFVLGTMIFITLRRDTAWELVGRVRTRMKGWE